MNAMQRVRIEKVTLNMGTGKDQTKLDKGLIIMKRLTGRDGVKTVSNKRIPAWGLRPGLAIGCKLTLRRQEAQKLLKTLLEAHDNTLRLSQFDEFGNISFGIPEYIDIPGLEYDPALGVFGLQVCVTLNKAGTRVAKRKVRPTSIPKKQRVSRDEAMTFMKQEFKITVGDAT